MLDCTVRATNINYHSVSMAAKIVQRSAVVIALLVLSTSVAAAQDLDMTLFALFETALLDDSGALQKLQKIFFNPDSKQSPEKVCLSVSVSVDDIDDSFCGDSEKHGPAFVYDDSSGTGMWYFNSYFELHQQVDDASDTLELANLIVSSGSAAVFYSFDPSFYSIMKTLSSSITLVFPYDDDSNDNIYINIAKLDDMPCWDDAVYAMRSVLMWVSFNCLQNTMPCI